MSESLVPGRTTLADGPDGGAVEALVAGRYRDALSNTRVTQVESTRARRMRLTILPPDSVELVVPRGTPVAQRHAFLQSNVAWIERMRAELGRRYRGERRQVPAQIELPAVRQRWDVVTELGGVAALRVQRDPTPALVLNSSVPSDGMRDTLRRWLIQEARTVLNPWLEREAARLGLQPRRMQVRLQRTRWGSCSLRGTISLNARALFLAPEIVTYLLVHELCHLRYMAHSRSYWALVERFEPDYLRLDASLSRSWECIPAWAAAG